MHCITGLRTARLIHLSRRSLLTGLGIGTVALLAATDILYRAIQHLNRSQP